VLAIAILCAAPGFFEVGWLLSLYASFFECVFTAFITIHEPTTPSYIPKRQRCKSFASPVALWLKSWGMKLAKHIDDFIHSGAPRHRKRRKYYRTSSGKHQYKLQANQKGFRQVSLNSRRQVQKYLCLAANSQNDRQFIFDTDSFTLAINNCASYCMTNQIKDFIAPPIKSFKSVQGLGKGKSELKGTVRWSIEDDQGRVTTFVIHDVLYVPNLPFRLLSPQHLAQNL